MGIKQKDWRLPSKSVYVWFVICAPDPKSMSWISALKVGWCPSVEVVEGSLVDIMAIIPPPSTFGAEAEIRHWVKTS